MKLHSIISTATLLSTLAISGSNARIVGAQMSYTSFSGTSLPEPPANGIDACAQQCLETPDGRCKGFTYGGGWKGGSDHCFLLSEITAVDKTDLGGPAFTSAFIEASAQECPLPPNGACGNASGATCCPSGSYCQPWNSGYYQCITKPDQCGNFETNVDYYGNDLATITGIFPWECCQKCRENPQCRAFTYENDSPQGPQKCYLKSSAAGRKYKVGVVSALRV